MLLKRILTVVIGAPFVIGAILCPRTEVFRALVALSLAIGLWEFFSIVGLAHKDRVFALLVGTLHSLTLLFCPSPQTILLLEPCLLVFVSFGFYCLVPKESLEGVAERVALTLLGALYVGTLGSFVGLSRDLPHGVFWVFVILAMTWLNDTFAYFAGHRFGRHRLAPLISPKKTVEGFVGGFVGSFLGFLIFWLVLENDVSLSRGAILTALVGIFGPLGDLSESLIKRSFHVKDSGQIIPGHGGLLDRIDALLFTGPVVYFFAKFTNLL